MKKIYLSLLLISCLAACSKENLLDSNAPKACFTTKNDVYSLNDRIFFDGSCAQNGDSYKWYMGDGHTFEGQSYNYQYKNSGTYEVSLVVYKGEQKDSTSQTITISSPDVILHEDEAIWEDVVWDAGVHEVEGTLNVVGGTLTIQPGTIIRFRPGAGFQVGGQETSGVIAHGTAEQPIIFTSTQSEPKAGDWGIVYVGQYAEVASFKHCTFEYGGLRYGEYEYAQILLRNGASIALENCTIQHVLDKGLDLREESYFDLFEKNEFIGMGHEFAIEMDMYQTSTLGRPNTYHGYALLMQERAVDEDLFLQKISTPYVFPADLNIGSETGATLTIEAGTHMGFLNNAQIQTSWSPKSGSLLAVGNAQDSITFDAFYTASLQDETWGGFKFNPGTTSETALAYCHVKNTGSVYSDDAVIEMRECQISVDHCTLKGDMRYGLNLGYETSFGSFTHNVIDAGNKAVMRYGGEAIYAVDNTNQFVKGTDLWIKPGTIDRDFTLLDLGVPYYVESSIWVFSDEGAKLTIEPGVHLKMTADADIQVGQGDSTYPKLGALVAIGTAEKPIQFTYAQDGGGAYGPYWQGFNIENLSDTTILDHVYVEGAYQGVEAWRDAEPITYVKNSTFENIETYGIVKRYQGPQLENNTFINCKMGDTNY